MHNIIIARWKNEKTLRNETHLQTYEISLKNKHYANL